MQPLFGSRQWDCPSDLLNRLVRVPFAAGDIHPGRSTPRQPQRLRLTQHHRPPLKGDLNPLLGRLRRYRLRIRRNEPSRERPAGGQAVKSHRLFQTLDHLVFHHHRRRPPGVCRPARVDQPPTLPGRGSHCLGRQLTGNHQAVSGLRITVDENNLLPRADRNVDSIDPTRHLGSTDSHSPTERPFRKCVYRHGPAIHPDALDVDRHSEIPAQPSRLKPSEQLTVFSGRHINRGCNEGRCPFGRVRRRQDQPDRLPGLAARDSHANRCPLADLDPPAKSHRDGPNRRLVGRDLLANCHTFPHGQTRHQQHPHRDSLPVQPAPTTGLRIHVGSRSDRGFEHEKRRGKRDHRRSADGPETLDDRFSFCLDGGQTDRLPHTSRVLAILTVLPPESPHDYLN